MDICYILPKERKLALIAPTACLNLLRTRDCLRFQYKPQTMASVPSSGLNVPLDQQIRFRSTRKPPSASKDGTPPKLVPNPNVRALRPVETGLIKDPNMRYAFARWQPSLLVAFRFIILIRFCAAMYTAIGDCDEGAPPFSLCPECYTLLTMGGEEYSVQLLGTAALPRQRKGLPDVGILAGLRHPLILLPFDPLRACRFPQGFRILGQGECDGSPGGKGLKNAETGFLFAQRVSFFATRMMLAAFSSFVEAVFYRACAVHISSHVGRYVLWLEMFSAGLYSAATAFLPSSFAMYFVMLGTAASLSPVDGGWKRISFAVFAYAIAGIVGWPFAVLLGVPLVLEQLFVRGTRQKVAEGQTARWSMLRARNFGIALALGLTVAVRSKAGVDRPLRFLDQAQD